MAEEAGPTTTLEVERKFRIHGLFRLGSVRLADDWALGEPGRDTLDATYFDTADLRLSRARLTLRRRVGGADEGWHLKVPAGVDAREEITLPLADRAADEPPHLLTDLVLPYVRRAPVEPVARLVTDRTTYPVVDPSGATRARLTDDSVSVYDGAHVAARFRELEVELVAGADDEVMDVMSAALTSAGAVEGGTISKVSRALGPLATAPPDIPDAEGVYPQDPARLAVLGLIRRHSRSLLVNDVAVRRDLPDSVHQMRVAARRLRSGLKVFAPVLDVERTEPLRAELAWLASALGEVRDREVLHERLLRDLDRIGADPHLELDIRPARRLVDGTFAGEESDARAAVLEALRSTRYLELLDALAVAAAAAPTVGAAEQPCGQVLPSLVRRAWKRLARDVRTLDVDGSDDDWHETRIAAKKARYSCEAVEPVFGKPARLLAERAEIVTELLGEHQDASMAADAVRRLAGQPRVPARTAFVLGVLCAEQRAAVARTRQELLAAWPEVSRARWRRWLSATDHR